MKNGEGRMKQVADLSWEKSPFSRLFKTAKTSQEFVKIWEHAVSPNLDKQTGVYSPPGNDSETLSTPFVTSSSKRSSSTLSDLPIPPPKRTKKGKASSAENTMDKEINMCYSGEC